MRLVCWRVNPGRQLPTTSHVQRKHGQRYAERYSDSPGACVVAALKVARSVARRREWVTDGGVTYPVLIKQYNLSVSTSVRICASLAIARPSSIIDARWSGEAALSSAQEPWSMYSVRNWLLAAMTILYSATLDGHLYLHPPPSTCNTLVLGFQFNHYVCDGLLKM